MCKICYDFFIISFQLLKLRKQNPLTNKKMVYPPVVIWPPICLDYHVRNRHQPNYYCHLGLWGIVDGIELNLQHFQWKAWFVLDPCQSLEKIINFTGLGQNDNVSTIRKLQLNLFDSCNMILPSALVSTLCVAHNSQPKKQRPKLLLKELLIFL